MGSKDLRLIFTDNTNWKRAQNKSCSRDNLHRSPEQSLWKTTSLSRRSRFFRIIELEHHAFNRFNLHAHRILYFAVVIFPLRYSGVFLSLCSSVGITWSKTFTFCNFNEVTGAVAPLVTSPNFNSLMSFCPTIQTQLRILRCVVISVF